VKQFCGSAGVARACGGLTVPVGAQPSGDRVRSPGATRLALLVVLEDGVQLSADLAWSIRASLRRQTSAAHVPSLILPVPTLPLTHNGKKSEPESHR
jgi:hypothetical protein